MGWSVVCECGISLPYSLLFVFVLTNKIYKHIKLDFVLSLRPRHRVGLVGERWWCPGGGNLFFEQGHVSYQIEGDDE